MRNHEIAKLFCSNSPMQEIYKTEKDVIIIGAWSRDVGTRECRLKLASIYPDGEVSPIREYPKSKLTDKKCLNDLANMDGITAVEIEAIHKAVIAQASQLQIQADSDGKSSLSEVYQALCEYVGTYEEPGRVFVRDGVASDGGAQLGLGCGRGWEALNALACAGWVLVAPSRAWPFGLPRFRLLPRKGPPS